LVEVGCWRVLEVEAGLLGQGFLDVGLVGLAPCALRANCDEADLDEFACVARAFSGSATLVGSTGREAQGESADCEESKVLADVLSY